MTKLTVREFWPVGPTFFILCTRGDFIFGDPPSTRSHFRYGASSCSLFQVRYPLFLGPREQSCVRTQAYGRYHFVFFSNAPTSPTPVYSVFSGALSGFVKASPSGCHPFYI